MNIQKLDEKNKESFRANSRFYDIEADFYDKTTELYIEEGGHAYNRIEDTISWISKKVQKNTIVDLGTGTGRILKVSKNYFKKIIGIDCSFNMLKKISNERFSVLQSDVSNLCLKANSVDVVTAFSVIHHLHEPSLLFNEIFKVLKPNGYFYADNDPSVNASGIHILKNQSFLYKKLMGFYYLPFRFSADRKRQKKNSDERQEFLKRQGISLSEYGKLAEGAECHLNIGLDPWAIKDELVKIGFSNVRIYFHFENGKKLKETISFYEKIKILLKILLKFDFTNFKKIKSLYESAPIFAIIAKK